MDKLCIASALALLLCAPASAQDQPVQNSQIYKRTLVPPKKPQLAGNGPIYTWHDGSVHTIQEPPPRRKDPSISSEGWKELPHGPGVRQ